MAAKAVFFNPDFIRKLIDLRRVKQEVLITGLFCFCRAVGEKDTNKNQNFLFGFSLLRSTSTVEGLSRTGCRKKLSELCRLAEGGKQKKNDTKVSATKNKSRIPMRGVRRKQHSTV
jgi:hypothetical protein